MEQELIEDDWNPDPKAPTILVKVNVDCSDKQLKKTRIRVPATAQDNNDGHAPPPGGDEDGDDLFKEKYPEIFDPACYDPMQDEKNQEWVNKKYKHVAKAGGIVLCCPMCFTQVCYEAQAHEYYENQYRAVFVRNVRVDLSRQVVVNEKRKQGTDGRQHYIQDIKYKAGAFEKGQYELRGAIENFDRIDEKAIEKGRELFEMFFVVECEACRAELGVYEVDSNIYHFHAAVPGVG